MCFSMYTSRPSRPKVARNQIIVYKRLTPGVGNKYQSPYKYFEFERGFHYYNEDPKLEIITNKIQRARVKGNYFIAVHEGLHSYATIAVAREYLEGAEEIVEMIIPKGAIYYTDGEEYVSSELIFPAYEDAGNLKNIEYLPLKKKKVTKK